MGIGDALTDFVVIADDFFDVLEALTPLLTAFDFVVVFDTPPTLGLVVAAAALASNSGVFVPWLDPNFPSVVVIPIFFLWVVVGIVVVDGGVV